MPEHRRELIDRQALRLFEETQLYRVGRMIQEIVRFLLLLGLET